MNNSIYPKMAALNIRKNAKVYVPYIIMGIFVIACYYMMHSLSSNNTIKNMSGGEYVISMVQLGVGVVSIFAVIFLFYINSFLMKRRKKELGLYNVLGMEKRHIARMLFFENIYVVVTDIAAGLAVGMILSKLMFLLLMKIINTGTVIGFQICAESIQATIIFFVLIFAVMFLYNILKIGMSNPIELLQGGMVGEKEPKTKVLIAIIGLVMLGAGYLFALMTKSPFKALNLFFLAVAAVIIGTYCLFTAGSIAVLKLLRKNKKFYYHPTHFTIISGMLYRMKQNAVGLANICILSTMVLISISTTVCMYSGIEKSVSERCPREINVSAELTEGDFDTAVSEVDAAVDEIVSENNAQKKNTRAFRSYTIIANEDKKGSYTIPTDTDNSYAAAMLAENGTTFDCIPLEDFNTVMGTDYSLSDGEVLLYDTKNTELTSVELNAGGQSKVFKVKDTELKNGGEILSDSGIVPNEFLMVVKDFDTFKSVYYMINGGQSTDSASSDAVSGGTKVYYYLGFDTDLSTDEDIELTKQIYGIDIPSAYVEAENKIQMRQEYYQLYGGFLFLGLFVGILFSVATALVIYYKQISEGYEDRERFDIMQKVGMSYDEVKRTIRSQVLMVFFLPLAVAGIHVAVSFRVIKMILKMLSMTEPTLFMAVTLITLLVFAVMYTIVFMITTKAYYGIVKREA